jgi:F0F1-type ATP synthase assembly protein I
MLCRRHQGAETYSDNLMTKKQSERPEVARQTANAMTLGLTTAICLVICLYFGWLFDKHFSTHPAGIFTGILLGLAAGIVQTIKQLREIHEHIERKKKSKISEND